MEFLKAYLFRLLESDEKCCDVPKNIGLLEQLYRYGHLIVCRLGAVRESKLANNC